VFAIANVLDTHNPHYSPPAEFESLADITPSEISALEAANDNQRYLLGEPLPEETRSQFESHDAIQRWMHDVYRAQVAYVDSLISNWLDETAIELSESLIVVVGGHGQMFGAEGMVGHHTSLHPHGIVVPAFVSFPQSWSPSVDITTPVSIGRLAEAISCSLTGDVSTPAEFTSVWSESPVVSCVDGPTWKVSKLQEQYGDSRN
jgi:arylsulfatase A-like enzyme